MSTARVAFLWHLHQPDYRDPSSGRPTMPWVRLHALRGYRDLLVELPEHGMRMTVNVVPSLLDQLWHYAEGGTDNHLEWTRSPAAEMRPEQLREIARSLPGGHASMADRYPSWNRLRGRALSGDVLTVQEFVDLQVWSTLQWFGATACRDYPEVVALRHKGSAFSESDKCSVLAIQDAILREIPQLLRSFAASDGPSFSVSPYFHPILPLLIDVAHAKRSLPSLPNEVEFSWPEDAAWQLRAARERLEELVGVAPRGLWPSEGAVSPEVVALAADAGFEWLCSDSGVLEKSQREGGGRPGSWDLGGGMRGLFRDHELSDRIGFQYSRWAPRAAALDLTQAVAERGGTVTIALDGENPWEAFPDAGGAFREALYGALEGGPVCAVTCDEAALEAPVGVVSHLHTGSWISADLAIWFGHVDDRAAWQAVAEARRAVAACPDPARRDTALSHIYAAQGSDWTWWYGEDFETRFAEHFDWLFRAHVSAAWQALGHPPPSDLEQPIGRIRHRLSPPTHPLAPVTGTRTAWIHWVGAGSLRLPQGAMATGQRRVSKVCFGWDEDDCLWMRLSLSGASTDEPIQLEVDREQLVIADHPGSFGMGVLLAVHTGGEIVLRAQSGRCVAGRVAGQRWGPVVLPRPEEPALSWWWV